MKICANKREGNKVLLEVEEDYPAFEAAADKALIEAGKEIKIPGFRQGKAPKDLIERSVNREALEASAAKNLIADLYPRVIEEAKIDPVDYPSIEIVQQKQNKPFIFKISVDVYPEVKLGKYKGLKVDKKAVEVTEEDLVKVLGKLKERLAKAEADGKTELLPLDDEFAKKVSRFGTLAELKEEMREAMLKDRRAEADADVRNKLVALVSAEAEADVPAGMVEHEINIMLDELRASLSQNNFTLEDYLKGIKKEEKALREELRKSAEIRAKGKIVLRAVAGAEKIKIEEEEMEKEMQSMTEATGEKLEEMKKRLDEGSKKFIEDHMLRRKALDLIVEKAKIREVKEEVKS